MPKKRRGSGRGPPTGSSGAPGAPVSSLTGRLWRRRAEDSRAGAAAGTGPGPDTDTDTDTDTAADTDTDTAADTDTDTAAGVSRSGPPRSRRCPCGRTRPPRTRRR
ncbi:hypothetical protein GO605_01890 [Streptomyces murinus]|nr:hypothetical protein GO605_01890 [Streptomyces murinus]